jgi:phosphoribosylformylglycinamidine cyclo-ligase
MENMLTYKTAGVDLDAAQSVVDDISTIRARTERPGSLFRGFGQFAACYDLSGYQRPVMVTTCDGIGTKMKPLIDYDMLEVAGRDLVAMCVNDILTANALPLVFLDYIGMAALQRPLIIGIIEGITKALEECDCILAGGETAEMPGMVEDGMIELSGFCVGAAEKEEIIDGSAIADGDILIGIPSDGFHANGWSLIRKIIDQRRNEFSDREIRELLVPTRIYFSEVAAMREAGLCPKGMAHITGGGIADNLQRVLGPRGATLHLQKWDNESVAKVIWGLDPAEAARTFNLGIGWIIVAPRETADAFIELLPGAVVLGKVCGESVDVKVAG